MAEMSPRRVLFLGRRRCGLCFARPDVEMPTCPYCAEDVPVSTETCPYCRSSVRERPRARSQSDGDDPGMRLQFPVRRSGWAIAAGSLGLLSPLFFIAPVALIVSFVAIHDLRKNPELRGMVWAIFGLIMGGLFTFSLVSGLFALLVDMN